MTTIKSFNFSTKLIGFFNTESPVFSTRMSMIICTILASIGIVLGIAEGSLAVQINGLIAAIDILNSLIFLTAVNQSVRSPDYSYNYGYGKYESLSILAGAGLLLIVLGYAFYESAISFGKPEEVGGNYWLLTAFSATSLVLMVAMYKYQRKMAKKYKMPILEYDAEIWKIDSFIEIGVLANLFTGIILKLLHYGHLAVLIDSITGIGILLFALKVPLKGSKNALNQLLDKNVGDEIQFQILGIIAQNVNRICEYKRVHTRQSGKDIFIEIDVVLPYDVTIGEKYDFELEINEQLKELYPTSVPRLYATACDGKCDKDVKIHCPARNYINEQKSLKTI